MSIGIISTHTGDLVLLSEPFVLSSTLSVPHYVLVVEFDGRTLKIIGLTEHRVRTSTDEGRPIPLKLSTVLLLQTEDTHAFSVGSFALTLSEHKFDDIAPIVTIVARMHDVFVKKNLEEEGNNGKRHVLSQISPMWGENKHGIASALYPTLWKKLAEDSEPKDFVYSLAVNALASPQSLYPIKATLVYLASAVAEVAFSDWACVISDMHAVSARVKLLHLPGIGPIKEVYMCCREGEILSYFGIVSGTTARPGLERAMIYHALQSSKHRNGYEDDELYEPVFVLSTPSLAITRTIIGCVSCKGTCFHAIPLVFDGGVYVTLADIKLIASRTFEHRFHAVFSNLLAAIPECVGIGDLVECTCNTIAGPDTQRLCPRCKLITSSMSSRHAPPTKKRVGRHEVNDQLPDVDALAEKFVTHCGMAGVLALGRRAHIMRQTLVRCMDGLVQKFGLYSLQSEGRGGDSDQLLLSTLSHMDTNSDASVPGLPPPHLAFGYKDLVEANWDPFSFAKYAAPCVLKILWECAGPSATRHPKYEERWHLLSFFLSFPNLLDNYTGLLTMWRKLFAHHMDPTERARLLDTPYFMASKYGNVFLENAITYSRQGRRWGCPKAVENGVCPFAAVTDSISTQKPVPEQVVKEITDIEDIRVKVITPFSVARVPDIMSYVTQHCAQYKLTDKVSVCKCVCSVMESDLTRRGGETPGMRMVVSHSVDFYRTLHSFVTHTKK
jgi:hypothetical protein